MEDVLDEWNTARLKLQIEGADDDDDRLNALNVSRKKKVCCLLPSPCLGLKTVALRGDIAYKIKEINEKLDDIVKAKDKFNFINLNVTGSNDDKPKRVPSISLVDESEICGRMEEKNALVSKLVSESSAQHTGPQIISLVGMGGIGKTTLAQLAYNNQVVKGNFDKTIWVCVSDSFDEFRIAKAIIEALEDSATNLGEFQSLMERIQKSIGGKKFFLVLDDVWNEDYTRWEPFYTCLKNGFHGSKILITTHKETVANMMGSINIISIKELAKEECWSLLKHLAFLGRSIEECEKLEQIGMKIVDKCKGLPLAAKIIGGLLRSKKTEEEWQRILDSELWEVEELEKGLLPSLLLSYNDLPSLIKRCFLYCAVFSKDYDIDKDELISLWMAQGYLNEKQGQDMELIGEEYFHILVLRSLFQEFEKDDDNNIIGCKMHDIVHDFVRFLSKDECFSMEFPSGEESFINSFNNELCHLMLNFNEEVPFHVSISKIKGLRSLLFGRSIATSPVRDFIAELLGELTCLRALDISADINLRYSSEIREIPTVIGKLIHLRCVNLAGQNIEKLPEILCELYNLQILDVKWCEKLKELPQGIGKLTNMRSLLNEPTDSLWCMPLGISALTNLRNIGKFVLDDVDDEGTQGIGCTLKSLKNLNLLRDCYIFGLGNVSDVGEAKGAELEKNRNLLVLHLNFYCLYEDRRKNEEDEEVLEALQPPPNLKKLSVILYRGNTFFPSWLMSLTNLRVLSLRWCENCEHLPPLGKLPSLEILRMHLNNVKRVGGELLGISESDHHGASSSSCTTSSIMAFPKLKSLEVYSMIKLEEWDYRIISEAEIMPRLSFLGIECCPKLKSLPDHLFQTTKLQTLIIRGSQILEERYREGSGEDWPKISRIPRIIIQPDWL